MKFLTVSLVYFFMNKLHYKMSHGKAVNVLNCEQLTKMKELKCHEKYRVRKRYSMPLAEEF